MNDNIDRRDYDSFQKHLAEAIKPIEQSVKEKMAEMSHELVNHANEARESAEKALQSASDTQKEVKVLAEKLDHVTQRQGELPTRQVLVEGHERIFSVLERLEKKGDQTREELAAQGADIKSLRNQSADQYTKIEGLTVGHAELRTRLNIDNEDDGMPFWRTTAFGWACAVVLIMIVYGIFALFGIDTSPVIPSGGTP